MARDETPILLLIVALFALLGIALTAASLASHQSMWGMMGGGMMGNGMMGDGASVDPGPGGFEWAILLVSAGFFAAALLLIYRARTAPMAAVVPPLPPPWAPSPSPAAVPSGSPHAEEPISELTLVRLLDEDERRMYLEIREHGGQMYQRELVAKGDFSKAKVTRVLDKLERRGLVVRERHGMTNRVRIVAKVGK